MCLSSPQKFFVFHIIHGGFSRAFGKEGNICDKLTEAPGRMLMMQFRDCFQNLLRCVHIVQEPCAEAHGYRAQTPGTTPSAHSDENYS